MRPITGVVVLFAALAQTAAAQESPALRLVQTIELAGTPGRLDHFAYDAASGRLFVANQGNASLDVIDVKAGKLLKQVAGQKRIHGMAIDPKSGRIFVGNGDPGECAVVDGRSYEVLKRIPVAKADNVQHDPHSGRIFVGHAGLTAIDPQRMVVEKELATPGALRAFRIDPTKPRLYANAVTNEVCVFDTVALKALAVCPLKDAGGNASMAIDPRGRRLFIGCRSEPRLLALDCDTGKEVARLDIPPGVDDLWYDAAHKRLYASTAGGELAVISQQDVDHYVRRPGLPAEKQAKTCAFDPGGGRLFLGVPSPSADHPARVLVYETMAP